MDAETEKFTFFYHKESPFSQFHYCEFNLDGITFVCAEQFMMYSKAKLFRDEEIAAQILKCHSPMEMKKFGRKVQNFDAEIWDKECINVVKKGNMAKFSQNPDLLEALFATKGTTLVEASPGDKIWGIGLSEKDPAAQSRATWRGKNLLGQALTEVREKLTNFDMDD